MGPRRFRLASLLGLLGAGAVSVVALAAPPAPSAAKPATSASARHSAPGKPSASGKASAAPPKGSSSVAPKGSASVHPAASASTKPGALLPVPKPGAVVAKGGPLLPVPKPGAKKTAGLVMGWTPPGYEKLVKIWHAPSPKAPTDAAGRPKLVLNSLNRTEKVELDPTSDVGDFAPTEIDKATWVIRCGEDQHPIDARLLNLLYAIQKRFSAGEIRFVSAYRAPYKGQGSNHGYGRAMDLVVPGATDEEVASYARSLGFVGVGIYPISGFVHVDVRERSFFWVDRSGPGQPNRTTGILAGEAASGDAKARKEGRIGAPSLAIGGDVDAALANRAKAVTGGAVVTPPPSSEPDLDDDVDYD
jgi:uncharacterized protein YcbK (DUF882 family)